MKKLLVIAMVLQSIFVSCEKENDSDFPCPVVSLSEVPAIVQSAFLQKYSKAVVEKWFKKDNTAYVAYFMNNSIKTLAYFKNDGTFIREETKGKKNKDHDDDDDDDGCECEIDD